MRPDRLVALFLIGCSGGDDPDPLTPGAPVIVEMALPDLLVRTPIEFQLSSMGGAPPLTWALTKPIDGLQLSFGGLLMGTPLKSGEFALGIAVRDALGREATADFQVNIYELPECGVS